MNVRVLLTIGLATLACMAEGCGSSGPARPKTTPVSGIVTYKGKPVQDAAIAFVPDVPAAEIAKHSGAFAVTDASGKFALMTFKAGDGAVPGKYKITVSKRDKVIEKPAAETGSDDYVDPGGGPPPPPPKNQLPARYAASETTDLTVMVPEGDAVDFEFELKD